MCNPFAVHLTFQEYTLCSFSSSDSESGFQVPGAIRVNESV